MRTPLCPSIRWTHDCASRAGTWEPSDHSQDHEEPGTGPSRPPPAANRISLSRKTSAPAGSSVSHKRLKLMAEMGLEAWFINRLCLLCFSTNYISKGAKITKSKRKNGSCYLGRSCCQIFYLNEVNLSLAAQQSITMEMKWIILAKTFQRMKTFKAKSKLGRFYFLIFSFPGDFNRGPPCFSSSLWFCEENVHISLFTCEQLVIKRPKRFQ